MSGYSLPFAVHTQVSLQDCSYASGPATITKEEANYLTILAQPGVNEQP